MSSQYDDDSKKGAWTAEEDDMLRSLVAERGPKGWSNIALCIPGRSGKSCRLRWCNQLDPNVNRNPFTHWEDAVIIRAWQDFSNKWAKISKLLQARTDNSVKNHWNSTLKRKYEQGQLTDNRFFTGGATLEQLLESMPPSEIFVPPVPEEELQQDLPDWGSVDESLDHGGSAHSGGAGGVESMGTPQSHFKARPRRPAGKRSRDGYDSDSEPERSGESDGLEEEPAGSDSESEQGIPWYIPPPRVTMRPDERLREGLRVLNSLPQEQRQALLMAARLISPMRRKTFMQCRGQDPMPKPDPDFPEAFPAQPRVPAPPPSRLPSQLFNASATAATVPNCTAQLATPASAPARSRLAEGGTTDDDYVLVLGLSPTDAAISLLDASNSPLPLLPSNTAEATNSKQSDAAEPAAAKADDARSSEEVQPAATPTAGVSFEPRTLSDATPIPFMGQYDGHGLFDVRNTDAKHTPDWVAAGRTPEVLGPLRTAVKGA